ncbi:NAD(P)-dependent dehydrogenase, short-chain alcohol dehydrogenase family [Andreprevotia lacus DSM 23236]|jgi:NAD(P)-dependent dehydrogenase (short-subunit alcohol dehydrogenase family)|uniref:NAD(P)-dependent dehydrogenase, short-chain alcohol dehydrogenase family n=1 Tax=Andreprevotia lacus DSM 23236 TaxID=1121001 RepID=A0A1W1XZF3_9NEIS|nr:SDR family NAD(P)-dependent oxidoreductase [Andreprevotia lacus]SMC29293.1 NAD(P)-dependent dehydrogenase, short-chain alcohol dehydrogenase family [Andreprevotia lacus DSM 23236]
MSDWKDYVAPEGAFKDRVILVTGAGQGIGAAAALALAKAGATVILSGRNEKKLSRTYDEIEAAGGPQPAAVPLDLAKAGEAEFAQLGMLIQKEFGRLDGILHAANGFAFLSPLSNQKLDEWVDQFRVNVAAPFALTRALFPLLSAAPDASVLVLGEHHALEPKAYWGGYTVSKTAQGAWIKIAADEWDRHPNVRINWLIPGPIQSPFRTKTHPGETKAEIAPTESILPAIQYWLGAASAGQSGQTLVLHEPQ